MRRLLPDDGTGRLMVLTQLLCVGTMLLAAAHPFGLSASIMACGALLLICLGLLSIAAARAHREAHDTVRRIVFAGLSGAALFGLLAELLNLAWHLLYPHHRIFPAPGFWLVLFGTHPCLLVAYASAIGWRPRGLRVEAIVDALLLIAAAAILGIELLDVAQAPLTAFAPGLRLLIVLWRSLPMAEMLLLAMLLASRGERLGSRSAAGMVLGTVAFTLASAMQGRMARDTSAAAVTMNYVLYATALAMFASALRGRGREAVPEGLAQDAGVAAGVRGWFIVASILFVAATTFVLGFRAAPSPTLSGAVAAFGLLLAVRAGHALFRQQRETRVLADSVVAGLELSAMLEQRVAERTAELAEAQRVLQRMWTLGQHVALELHPSRVLQRFMEAVMDVAQADGGSLGLTMDDTKLRVAAAIGICEGMMGTVVPTEGSAMGRAIRTGKPWMEADVARHPDMIHQESERRVRGPTRGILVVPLHRRGETIGALALSTLVPHRFTDLEVARIESMTDMLTVALANAELVENLRQAEWRFRTLFRAAPDAVLTVLQSGRVREANDCVRDIVGLDPVQVVGSTLADLVAGDDQARLNDALDAAFAGRPARLEVRFRRVVRESDASRTDLPREEIRVVSLAASRVPEADPPAVLLIGRDITGEREMRARLLETERLAAVGELVAGVAHEVNNPLSAISAYAQLLLRDDEVAGDQRESVEVIQSETMRASQVVKDLLAFARRSEPRREAVDLGQLVERTTRLHGYQLSSGNVELMLDLPADLPAVVGDARQLQQVVLNLVTNSIQAMAAQGAGTLRIATRHDRAAGRVTLEIEDSGPGIPPGARARIFEPFFTTKPEGEGTGLGLSVSYGIIAAHGGTLSLARTSPAGTAFLVSLPAATAGPAPDESSHAAGSSSRSALSGVRLLFVDDEPAIRGGVEAFGRLRGFTVVTAEDGQTALDQMQSASFDAVVCDLRMPGMDGFAFHARLRQEWPGLAARTIFVTGDVLGAGERPPAAARQPTLVKPFTFERLEETVVAVLRGE